MKKIIVILIALLSFGVIADAQVVVQKKTTRETLMNIRGGWVSLVRSGEHYMLTLRSDNQFDNAYIIFLGNNRKDAINSLQALADNARTLTSGDSVEFNDGNQNYYLFRGTFKGEVWFKSDNHAGYGKTSKRELDRLLEHLCFEVQ